MNGESPRCLWLHRGQAEVAHSGRGWKNERVDWSIEEGTQNEEIDLSRRLWGLFWGRCVLAEVWKMNRSYFPVVRKTGTVGWKDCCVCEGSKEKRSRIYSRNWKPTGGWTTEGKLQSLVRWAQNNRVYWLIAVLLWGSYLTSLTIITVLTSHGCYED